MKNVRWLVLCIFLAPFAISWGQSVWGQAPAPAAPPAIAPGPVAAPPAGEEPMGFLEYVIKSSGIIGLVIFAASVIMVAVISMLILQYRRDSVIPPEFVGAFENAINGRDFKGAFELAKADESLIARLLAAGMGKFNQGYDESMTAVQDMADEEQMFTEHKLGYLALFAALGPLLGLLGTVLGMVESFNEIATAALTPKPKDLAKGISTALVLTLEGLLLAIPSMIAYNLLRNRVAVMNHECGKIVEKLMGRLNTLVSKKAAPAPQPPA